MSETITDLSGTGGGVPTIRLQATADGANWYDVTDARSIVITATTIRAAVETLRRNNVPAFRDGSYRLIGARDVTSAAIPPSFYDITSGALSGRWSVFEATAEKVRRNNEERRALWRYRICAGIDAARRASPVTATEIRERNGWRVSWRVVRR